MSVTFVSGEDNVDRPSCSKLPESPTVWSSAADGAKVGGKVGPLRPPGVLLPLHHNEKVLLENRFTIFASGCFSVSCRERRYVGGWT